MKPLVLPFPGSGALGARIAAALPALVEVSDELDICDLRQLAARLPLRGRDLVLVSPIAEADHRLLPLLFLARRARGQAAASVTLVAADLPENCEDLFASVLRPRLDAIVTVRAASLQPAPSCTVVPAWPPIARFLREQVDDPLLVAVRDGEPWMEELASWLTAPLLSVSTLRTTLDGARGEELSRRQPILLCERIRTADALEGTASAVRAMGFRDPIAVAVHAGPGQDAAIVARRMQLWTTNTRPDPTNRIDVSGDIAAALSVQWARRNAAVPLTLPLVAMPYEAETHAGTLGA